MKLVYLRYYPTSKFILLLYLGETTDKWYGIDTSTINDVDRMTICSNIQHLKSLVNDERVYWIRKNCPESYKNGYREINKNNSEKLSEHPLDIIKQ